MSGAVRIGPRLLVCPYCTLTLYNAGPGRAFCEGNQNPPNAMQPHEEVEMVAYTVVAWKERDEALSRAEAAERERDSLRLVEGAYQARKRDNAYLVALRDEAERDNRRLREALRMIDRRLTSRGSGAVLTARELARGATREEQT